MNLEPIVCSQCGAPLQVPAGVGFVTCNHCHAALAVKREASVTYTEAVEKLATHTEELRQEVAELRYERELERIDREWAQRRESFLTTTRRGNQTLPSRAGGIVMIIVGVVMGGMMTGIFTVVAGGLGTVDGLGMLACLPLAPLMFMAISIIAGISMLKKAGDYERAQAEYERRRAAITRDSVLEKDNG